MTRKVNRESGGKLGQLVLVSLLVLFFLVVGYLGRNNIQNNFNTTTGNGLPIENPVKPVPRPQQGG